MKQMKTYNNSSYNNCLVFNGCALGIQQNTKVWCISKKTYSKYTKTNRNVQCLINLNVYETVLLSY